MLDLAQLFPEDKSQQRSGCYIVDPNALGINYRRALVPLRHLDYHLEIVNSLLHITLTQKYYNPTNKFLEVNYSLPISPDSSVYKFQAEFNNVILEGTVKQKQEAKKQYEKAKSQGKQTAIGSIDTDSKDIMNISIGNIPPLTEFKITISLLQQMKISVNTFYRLLVPSTISPRFLNTVENILKVPQHMQQKGQNSGKADFTWTFKVQMKTTRKVVFYESPSHKLKVISQNNEGTQTLLALENQQIPNKDFHFVYTTQNFHLPSYVVGKSDTSATVMLSFIPRFCSLSINDAYKAEIQNKSYQVDMEAARGDYVFFLDRSGSMEGSRIEKAKQALVMFLKSLPEDSYFNVISFGDSSKRMFQKSEKYNSEKFQTAKDQISKMSADMGGTEIYNSLKNLLEEKVHNGYPRHVFILTDGGVSNTQGVIKMVEKSTKYCRVHCIGIGNGASLDLIQGCSKVGKGKYIMISDNENPSNKIIELLQSTLTPLITKLDLKMDSENNIQSIIPNPKSIPYILKDDVINFYVTFNKTPDSTQNFVFQYEDSVTKLPYKSQIKVDFEKGQNQPFVDKMSHLKVLRSLQTLSKNGQQIQDYMYYVKISDYKQQAIKYSIKNQILSEYTAFICVGKQLVDGKYQQYKDTGDISIQVEQPAPQQKSYMQMLQGQLRSRGMAMKCEEQEYQEEQQCGMGGLFDGCGGGGGCGAVPAASSGKRAMISKQCQPQYQQQCDMGIGLFDDEEAPIGQIDQKNIYASDKDEGIQLRKEDDMISNLKQQLQEKCQQIKKQKVQSPRVLEDKGSVKQKQQGIFSSIGAKISGLFHSNKQQHEEEQKKKRQLQQKKKQQEQKSKNKQYQKQKQKDKEEKKQQPKKQKKETNKQSVPKIQQVVDHQNINGSWTSHNYIDSLAKNPQQLRKLTKQLGEDVVITQLVVVWIQKYYTDKQYALIVKKALSWLKKKIEENKLDGKLLESIQSI